MQAILTGIYSLYSADADLKAALPGKLWLELAPQGTDMTYATYMLVSSRPEYMLGGESYELPRIQFDIYAETNLLRLTAYEKLITVYDDARPAATGYSPVIMERTFQQMMRDGDQNQYYRAIIEYECRFLNV